MARRLGVSAEISAGITKNTSRIYIPGGGFRVPDLLDDASGVLGEVKNVQRLSYTAQLRDYVAWAEARGYTFRLWIRPTTQPSGPLQQEILRRGIPLEFLP